MSKKRTSSESGNDEQTNEGSDLFHQDAKRAKLISLSDTTLQDLPIELIEYILFKAAAMEVCDMKLAKSVWKEKADLVISRLRTVCSQWSYILTTDFFRKELHRILDGIAEPTIRLEILHQSPLPFCITKVSTMKDEIFMLYVLQNGDFAINVYDRHNLAEVKDVIPLPGIRPDNMEACSLSNCVYILHRRRCNYITILRIAKDSEHQFNITPVLNDIWMPNTIPSLSVTSNGCLILARRRQGRIEMLGIYNSEGSVQSEMKMHSSIPALFSTIPMPNGNLLLLSLGDRGKKIITEINMDVKIIRQQELTPLPNSFFPKQIVFIRNGWNMVAEKLNQFDLFDSEGNLLVYSTSEPDDGNLYYRRRPAYNSERNEVVAITNDEAFLHGVLTIFRFTEE